VGHEAPPDASGRWRRNRVGLRHVDDPNGARNDIAGVTNATRNVVGVMPYLERAADPVLGAADGAETFRSVVQSVALARGGVR
jgi:phosphoribosylformylglycinamidine (FGAM) synthase-like amidotransferase family enzyme